MVAAVGAWGDSRRGEEAGDSPRGQHVLWSLLRCRALRGCSAANLSAFVGVGRVRAVGRVAQ